MEGKNVDGSTKGNVLGSRVLDHPHPTPHSTVYTPSRQHWTYGWNLPLRRLFIDLPPFRKF